MKLFISIIGLIFFFCNSVFGQEIKLTETRYCTQERDGALQFVQTTNYTIQNSDTSRIIIFFIEEENTSASQIELLKRKVLRKYNDFSLSMLEWEANMDIDDICHIVPELFVKCLEPGESFAFITYSSNEQEEVAKELPKHILICKDIDFSNLSIGLPNFVKCLKDYKFEYPYSYIVLDENPIKKLVQGKSTCN